MRLLSLLLLLSVIPDICLAQAFVGRGNWCLVLDEIENCSFNTADDCYSSAADNGGYCQQNSRKPLVAGSSAWCVVSASGRDCTYANQRSCFNAALQIDGGCVSNTELALEKAQNSNQFNRLLDEANADESVNGLEDLGDRLQEAQRSLEEAQ